MTTDVKQPSWDISDLRKMASMNRPGRSDVWGPPAAGMFGNYPNPNTRGTTPWSTTNDEYGRWKRSKGKAGEGWDDLPEDEHCQWGGFAGEGTGGQQQQGDGFEQSGPQDPPMGYTDGRPASNQYGATDQADQNATTYTRPECNVPSANDTRYLIASRPMQSYDNENQAHDSAVQARQELKTGAGKRFMIQECNRFWDNMKSLSASDQQPGSGGGFESGSGGYGGDTDQPPKYSWETDTQVLKVHDEGQGGGDTYDYGQSGDYQYGNS